MGILIAFWDLIPQCLTTITILLFLDATEMVQSFAQFSTLKLYKLFFCVGSPFQTIISDKPSTNLLICVNPNISPTLNFIV